MKRKEDFMREQLNTDKLTPLQWDGILRAMDAYAEQQVKNRTPDVIKFVESNDIESGYCRCKEPRGYEDKEDNWVCAHCEKTIKE